MKNFFSESISALDAGEPFALGIISGVKGSSPQKQGARALYFAGASEQICQPGRDSRARHPVLLPRKIFQEPASSTTTLKDFLPSYLASTG